MWLLALHGCAPLGTWDLVAVDELPVDGPRIVASPGRLDFGRVSVTADGYGLAELTLRNIGDAAETVTGHDEPLGSGAFVVDAPPLLELEPGDALSVAVRYLPTTEQSDEAELVLDPGSDTVRLVGAGAAPVLRAEDPTFDDVVLGCTGAGSVALHNDGSEPLALLGFEVDGAEFAVTDAPSTIAAGAAAAVALTFTPAGGGARGTTLRVRSDDPLHPEIGVPLSALGYEGERVTESFRYTPSNPTDIVFAVTTAGPEMAAQLGKAGLAIEAFVAALREANIDYHVTALSGESPCPTATPGWSDRSDTSLQTEAVIEQGFTGGTGPWDADLLGLVAAALARTDDGGCLAGFRRDDADLHVVVVAAGPGDGGAPAAAAELADAAPASFRLSGLLPVDGACGAPATDYAAAVAAFGGTHEDLCGNDWPAAFEAFADLPDGAAAVRFPLAEVPVPESIEVLAEGLPFSAWTWDAADNAIVFDREDVPALGAEIVVTYVSSVACE